MDLNTTLQNEQSEFLLEEDNFLPYSCFPRPSLDAEYDEEEVANFVKELMYAMEHGEFSITSDESKTPAYTPHFSPDLTPERSKELTTYLDRLVKGGRDSEDSENRSSSFTKCDPRCIFFPDMSIRTTEEVEYDETLFCKRRKEPKIFKCGFDNKPIDWNRICPKWIAEVAKRNVEDMETKPNIK